MNKTLGKNISAFVFALKMLTSHSYLIEKDTAGFRDTSQGSCC